MRHQGNCHCGKHRFEVDIPNLDTVEKCECGLCAKTGALWFASPEPIQVTRGFDDTLAAYNTDDVIYKFCSTCGTGVQSIHLQSQKGKYEAINIRTLLDVNPFQLEAASPNSETVSSIAQTSHDIKQYSGRCHCGKITLAVTTPPLPELEIKEDNCSICVRNAFIGIYPALSAVQIGGQEHTQDYTFNQGFNGHPFCKTCGVHAFMTLHGPPASVVERLSEEKQRFVRSKLAIRPVNVRVLEGVEWDRLRILREDEGTERYSLGE